MHKNYLSRYNDNILNGTLDKMAIELYMQKNESWQQQKNINLDLLLEEEKNPITGPRK